MFLFALLLLVIYKIGRTLIIFAVALIVAHLLSPVVEFVERIIPQRVPRVAALLLVYIVLIGVLVAALIPVGERISSEAAGLAARLPAALEGDPLAHVPIPRWLEPLRPQLTDVLRDRIAELGRSIVPVLSRAGTQIVTGIGSVLGVILIPILSFFFLKDGAAMREAIVENIDSRRRALVDTIFSDLHTLLSQYIRALVLLSIATFIFYTGFLSIVGVPYPVLLAGVAAVLEFIPAVGPLIGGVTIVLVAATGGPGGLPDLPGLRA